MNRKLATYLFSIWFEKRFSSECSFPVLSCKLLAVVFVVLFTWNDATAQTFTTPGVTEYTVPAGVRQVRLQTWGGGGKGGDINGNGSRGGGGGGAYSESIINLVPGETYFINVGSGSTNMATPGGDTWINTSNTPTGAIVLAKGGNSSNNMATGATGGALASGIGDIRYSGGIGGTGGGNGNSRFGGGGGSSAGTSANGGNGGTGVNGSTPGQAPPGGGNGGAGSPNANNNGNNGSPGNFPGGGGGGSSRQGGSASFTGGAGAGGQLIITPIYADLVVEKEVDEEEPFVGDEVTFTITVTNDGPEVAESTEVDDLLPSGYTFSNATPSVGSYNNATGIWTIGNLAVSASATLTITAVVNGSGNYLNIATAYSVQSDPTPFDAEESAFTNPIPLADLTIDKTVSEEYPVAGDVLVFTIEVANNGPSPATNVEVQDEIPNGFIFMSASATNGTFEDDVWDIGSLGINETAMLDIEVLVDFTGTYLNSAEVSANEIDPDEDNNEAMVEVFPIALNDLVLTKEANEYTPNVEDEIVFTLTAYNNGPSQATDVVVEDILPGGFSYVSHSGGNYNDATGIWDIGVLNKGATATLSITVEVLENGSYFNTASIESSGQDPDLINNISEITIEPIYSKVEIDVLCSVQTYDLSDFLVDNLPFGSIISWHTDTPATEENAYDGDLTEVPYGVYYLAFYNQSEECYSQTTEVELKIEDCADLEITKIIDEESPNVNDQIEFTIVVTNNGPNDATDVVIADILPDGYTYVSSTATEGTYNPVNGQWAIASLEINQNEELSIFATVNPPTFEEDEYLNVANVSASEEDPNMDNNEDTASSSPLLANLSIEKTADEEERNVGQEVVFTILVENSGTDTAENVIVNDLLPIGFNYISDNPSQGSYNNLTGVWTVGNISNNSSATLAIVASVLSTGSLLNQAQVSSDTYDIDLSDNQDQILIIRTGSKLITNPMIHSRMKNN